MKLLAIDTATENCSAALWLDAAVRHRECETARDHAGLILGMVDELMAEGGVALRDLDAIAFGRGPGSFTGVRLAAAVTQGLAFAAGLPVLPVSDLRALALRALQADPSIDQVLCCADARMGEVYFGLYRRDTDLGAVPAVAALPEAVLAPEAVPWHWQRSGQAWAVGRGFAAYPVLADRAAEQGLVLQSTWLPRARDVATLAARDYALGNAVPASQAVPVYLRDRVVISR